MLENLEIEFWIFLDKKLVKLKLDSHYLARM